MYETIITAAFALIGTLAGTFAGIITGAKLTTYRIEQLEKKVDKHNNFASRMPVIEEQLKNLSKKMEEIERR